MRTANENVSRSSRGKLAEETVQGVAAEVTLGGERVAVHGETVKGHCPFTHRNAQNKRKRANLIRQEQGARREGRAVAKIEWGQKGRAGRAAVPILVKERGCARQTSGQPTAR